VPEGTLTGGMVISRALARHGVRKVFPIAGASHTFLRDALERDGFAIMSSRHETGAVGAADGYARVTARHRPARAGCRGGTPRHVVLVTGDGSFGFYPAEVRAAVRAGLPLVVVVCNDAAWGTEKNGERLAIGRSVNTELGALPYEHVGTAFGGTGIRVERLAELGPALDAAFAESRPCVVNVLVDPETGAAFKTEPHARLILFDDLATSLAEQHAFGGRET
jgi:thiamine pyrophosphate-dependent acetolactate synthase large subunit-like protein